ncbi:MAG: hypothetical protein ABH878_04500, partial [bacterium]
SPPSGDYYKGLFLITNGSAPAAETAPIGGMGGPTEGNNYQFIYRDLMRGDTLYTWYHNETFSSGVATSEECDLQKIIIHGRGAFISAEIEVNNFNVQDYALKNISGFYQYIDTEADPDVYHQFIVAKTYHGGETWDVWHREKTVGVGGFPATWEIICGNLQDHISNFACQNLFAFHEGECYAIYLNCTESGWYFIKVAQHEANQYEITLLENEDAFIPQQIGDILFNHK